MLRRFVFGLITALFCLYCVSAGQGAGAVSELPDVNAEAAVLLCADNGEVIFAKNENTRVKPASTTKIMTALIALEGFPSKAKTVEITKEMYSEGSSMYLKEGEKLSLYSLTQGLLTVSGNDAANAIAISTAGSIEAFAELMNEKADQIGMKNTHFTNPSGLDDDDHYTTAYDMALLMACACDNADFAQITSQSSAKVDFINPPSKSVTYSNHNRLLSLYPDCIGGKTGYTIASGRTLVTCAQRDSVRLVAVTMNDKTDWNDHIEMYEYGFSKLEAFNIDDTHADIEVPVSDGLQESVRLNSAFPLSVTVKKGSSGNIRRTVEIPDLIEAPVDIYTYYGRVVYTLDGEELAACPLYSSAAVEKRELSFAEKIREFFGNLFKKD